jgi:hypothetical protein
MAQFRTVFLLAVAATALSLAPSRTARPHGEAAWIADGNFVSMAGEKCCGEHDCHSVVPQSVQLVGDTYFVNYDGRTYSVSDRQAQDSIDERYWICVWGGGMKCFFRPKIGS